MIIAGRPPNFEKICKVFPEARAKGTIFAYSPNIYILDKDGITNALEAHENVHILRQGTNPETWWDRYLVDREFRLEEELIAHTAEYKHLLEHGSRSERRNALKIVSNRLSSGMYSFGLSPKKAADMIDNDLRRYYERL